jgi:hypothetical protein
MVTLTGSWSARSCAVGLSYSSALKVRPPTVTRTGVTPDAADGVDVWAEVWAGAELEDVEAAAGLDWLGVGAAVAPLGCASGSGSTEQDAAVVSAARTSGSVQRQGRSAGLRRVVVMTLTVGVPNGAEEVSAGGCTRSTHLNWVEAA